MELYLVRHAIAEERDPGRWAADGQRPLSSLGIRKFRSAARGLARFVPQVDELWASPLRRAWQTAEILQHEAGWPAPSACAALEPDRSPHALLREVTTKSDLARLALVGHAPTLDQLLALAVLGQVEGTVAGLRKGGVACIAFSGEARPASGELLWLSTPRLLRSLDV